MKITKRQLKRLISEAISGETDTDGNPIIQGPWSVAAANLLKSGDLEAAMDKAFNHWMIDDTWHMEEDALEDLLTDLGPNPTPEDVEAAGEEWIDGVRSDKWKPKTREEMDKDWSRTDVTRPRQR